MNEWTPSGEATSPPVETTKTSTTGAAALIDALAALGTRYIFGIPGTHTLLPYDLLHEHPTIRPIILRHEAGAGFAADGYARVTGRTGICFVVPGPGATNVATAALVASSDRVPLILITASVPNQLQGRGAVHDADLELIFRPLVKAQIVVNHAEEIPAAVLRSSEIAQAEPPGPVQLLIPYDLFGRTLAAPIEAAAPQLNDPFRGASLPPVEELERVLAILLEAHSPLLYAGHGVVRAGAGPALIALAEALEAPVLTSNKARGVISEDHPLAAGVPSMAGAATLTRAADVCLALGTRFNEYTTLTWRLPLPSRLVRVDRDPAVLDQNYPAEVGLCGDVAAILDWLVERMPTPRESPAELQPAVTALRERRQAANHEFMADHATSSAPFHPRFVARLLRDALPADAIVTSDGSATESWLYEPGFTVTRPSTLIMPEIQQTMGFAVGAAIGAALGAPDRPVVAVVGDGSLTMALGELATLVSEGIPLTVVVFNDGTYNALRVRQDALFSQRFVGTLLGAVDFAQVAHGLGLSGSRIASATELRERFAEAAAPRQPLLIDVPIDPTPLSERYTAVVEAGG
ncbi:MAG TPA: thiamine pyrophosphate-binding protein [Nitrolancea sp.]|nr:thiamine pyrophosphate-binding protein [Nitrolancea sp.]